MTDSHTTEYISRLREEPILLALADKVSRYLQRINDMPNLAHIALRQAEHFYYKTEAVYDAMRGLVEAAQSSEGDADADAAVAGGADGAQDSVTANGAAPDANGVAPAADVEERFDALIKLPMPHDFELPADCHALMRGLVKTIYVHGEERSKARAVLTHIYHKSIHGDFHGARDSLLMSHLQDQVSHLKSMLIVGPLAQKSLCPSPSHCSRVLMLTVPSTPAKMPPDLVRG
jgi:translation initiation factor 3 subunit C